MQHILCKTVFHELHNYLNNIVKILNAKLS